MKNTRPILNLRNLRAWHGSYLDKEIFLLIDKFVMPYLTSKKRHVLEIIVGRGLNSSQFIDGKNPTRYYCEQYLTKLNLHWKNHSINPGVIEIYIDS